LLREGGGGSAGDNKKNFHIYFYNKPIFPDREVNIGRLAKSAQQSGGGGAATPPAYAKMQAKTEFYNSFIICLFIN
jgi:hypothetical protein